jgi:hypothetical protein
VDTARTKRLVLVELFIFFTLAGTTALLFQPLMAVINRNINVIQEELVKQGETALKRSIRYSSMSPSLAGSVEIRDLAIGGADTLFTIDRLYLDYSLWNLIRGKGYSSIKYMVLERPELTFDFERDRDLLDLFSRKEAVRESGKLFNLPAECIFLLRDGKIQVKKGGNSLGIANISINGEVKEGVVNLDGQWYNPDAGDLPGISLDGSIQGTFSDTFTEGNIFLNLNSVNSDGFKVENMAFELAFFEDKITFDKIPDKHPLELSVAYMPRETELSGYLLSEDLLLGNVVSFFGPLEGLGPVMGLRLSGNASFALQQNPASNSGGKGRNSLEYQFEFSAVHEQSRSPIRSFFTAGGGNQEELVFSRCTLEAMSGSVEYTGDLLFNPLLPRGTITFSGFTMTGDGGINGTLSFSRSGQTGRFRGSYISLGQTLVSSITGQFEWKEAICTYSLELNCFHETLGSTISSTGSYSKDPRQLDGSIGMQNFYASDMINMVRPFFTMREAGNPAAQISVSTEIFFSTDFNQVSYNSSRFLVEYAPETSFTASISGSEKELAIMEGQAVWRQGSADFGFNADFTNQDDIRFDFKLSYLDFSYAFDGNIQDRRILNIRGSNDFSLSIQSREGTWSGDASVSSIPIPYRGHRAYVNLDSAMHYVNSSSWNINLNRLEIQDMRSTVLLQGQANQNGLNLDRIYYKDRYGELTGTGAAVWNGDFSIIDASLYMADETDTERITADIFYEEKFLDFHAAVSDFRADRIEETGKNILVSGELYGVMGDDGYYLVNLSLGSLTGRTGLYPFSLSALGLLDPERLIISQVSFSLDDVEVGIPYLSVDRSAGRLETEGLINGEINSNDLGLDLSLGLNFQPLDNWMDLERSISSLSGIIDVRHASINSRETADPFSFVFSRTRTEEESPGIIRVFGGPQDMLRLEITETGSLSGIFTASLSNPSPVQGNITGVLDGTEIDAWATDIYIDLAELWELTPINKEVVNFTGGFVAGETRIYGSIFDPEFEGGAWASGVTMSIPQYVAAEIGPGSGELTLDGDEISFGPIGAVCGNGNGEISGWIRYSRWIPSFNLDITVNNPIPFDFDISGIIANGNVSGKANLLMENKETLTITGSVEASDTELTINPEEIAQSRAGLNQLTNLDIITDVYVRAGRRVEFLWPNVDMPMLRAYGDVGTGVRIVGDSRIPQFTLDGDVILRGGELYYLQRSFYIREGQIFFNSNAPEIDPLISARAEIRDRNDDGPVTIAMIVDNTPLSTLATSVPRFESNPALSQMEIYSLLGQVPTLGAEVSEQENVSVFTRTVTELVVQTVFVRKVERQIRNILGVDMFSFRTQILQNAVFEAVRNREPEEQPSTMGNYLDNTAIFIGKYIGSSLFFQTMLSFRYDQYQTEYGGMKLEPDIGIDLQTPLFDVRWNVSPQHPENLYVNDQSISLVWHWSL